MAQIMKKILASSSIKSKKYFPKISAKEGTWAQSYKDKRALIGCSKSHDYFLTIQNALFQNSIAMLL